MSSGRSLIYQRFRAPRSPTPVVHGMLCRFPNRNSREQSKSCSETCSTKLEVAAWIMTEVHSSVTSIPVRREAQCLSRLGSLMFYVAGWGTEVVCIIWGFSFTDSRIDEPVEYTVRKCKSSFRALAECSSIAILETAHKTFRLSKS